MATRLKWYVGVKAGKPYQMFKSKVSPTMATHGKIYDAVIGSFSTREGAWVMAEYGKGNPHITHVSDAESMVRNMKKAGEAPWRKKNPGAAYHKRRMKKLGRLHEKASERHGYASPGESWFAGRLQESRESYKSAKRRKMNPAHPVDDFYTSTGKAKYDYMGIAKRIPIHARKAKEFLRKGDKFNAGQHARAVISLGATGYIGTKPYKEAKEVLAKLRGR